MNSLISTFEDFLAQVGFALILVAVAVWIVRAKNIWLDKF
jgi:hypothetical protein